MTDGPPCNDTPNTLNANKHPCITFLKVTGLGEELITRYFFGDAELGQYHHSTMQPLSDKAKKKLVANNLYPLASDRNSAKGWTTQKCNNADRHLQTGHL